MDDIREYTTTETPFDIDFDKIKTNAKKEITQGANTAGFQANRKAIIEHLNGALATEIVCFLRYKRHYHTAAGLKAEVIAEEFNVHAQEELSHADMIAARIAQLGGEPNYAPETLVARSHAEYSDSTDLEEMIKENLVAERIAVDSYHAMIKAIGDSDPTTRRLLESILEQEEEHADELADWI